MIIDRFGLMATNEYGTQLKEYVILMEFIAMQFSANLQITQLPVLRDKTPAMTVAAAAIVPECSLFQPQFVMSAALKRGTHAAVEKKQRVATLQVQSRHIRRPARTLSA